MTGVSIKATWIKPNRRSRGRVATYTRTIMRNINPDAHPSQIMSVMAGIIPMLERIPASYQAHGVRYEVLRVERRVENGVRIERAVFKDERAVHTSFAREMRRRHRAERRAKLSISRTEARRRRIIALTLLAMARNAHIKSSASKQLTAQAPMLARTALYLSAPRGKTLSAIPSG